MEYGGLTQFTRVVFLRWLLMLRLFGVTDLDDPTWVP